MTVQSLYNIVDSYFVSLVSEKALRAVSFVFPIQILLIAFAVGTAQGVNSCVARSLGAQDEELARRTATHGQALALLNATLFILGGFLFSRPFLALFTQDADVLQMGTSYMFIVTSLSMGVFLQIMLEKTLQATGNMVLPMVIQSIGAVTNCLLDPLFIFGLPAIGLPAMGVAGAALATVFAQYLAWGVGLFLYRRQAHRIPLSLRGFRFDRQILSSIYTIAVPAILMQAVAAFLTMVINTVLSAFSEVAISVYGIAFKLQSFVGMPVFGLTQGMMPLIAYNYGARKIDRMHKTVRYGLLIMVGYMSLGTLVFQIFPGELLGIFHATPEMLAIGVRALRIISIAYPFAAFSIAFITFFQSVGHGHMSLISSLLRQVIFLLPIAYWGPRFFGIDAVWAAYPIAEVFAMLVALALYKHLQKSDRFIQMAPQS